MKDRYEGSKVYIGQLKDKIEHLKTEPESTKYETSDDDYSKLKTKYKILKHELKTVELKLILKKDGSRSELDLKSESIDLRS